MRRFCVRCGAEVPVIIDGLCPNCLLDEGRIFTLPKEVKVTTCSLCSSIKVGSRWVSDTSIEDYVRDIIISSMDVHRDVRDVNIEVSIEGNVVTARVKGLLGGITLERDFMLKLSVNKVLCPQCIKIKGSYFEALVQIRSVFKFRDMFKEHILNNVLNSELYSKYISSVELLKEGIDVKVISQGVARKLASNLISNYGGYMTSSWRDTGYSSGKKHSKLTISTRLLGLMLGDVVLLRGSPAVVYGLGGEVAKFKLLDSGKLVKFYIPKISLDEVELLDRNSYELLNAKVVNLVNDKVIVKDLKRGLVFELPLIDKVDVGSKIKLLIYGGNTYMISTRSD